MRLSSFVTAVCASLLVAGCATAPDRNPVPFAAVDEAEVFGLDKVRMWGDAPIGELEGALEERNAQIREHRPHLFRGGNKISFLAISGGGNDGAFGAGLLVGWTARGDRPDFEVVTGVSTGALAAPFAFLGPGYDPQLRQIYTTYTTEDLVSTSLLSGAFGGEAFTDNKKLANIIAKYVDRGLLNKVAAEHQKGRRLYIGTTNLDAQRPVIWDMGAIAASGHPEALKLFRQVLLASASIPGVFPPARINVTVDGKRYDELHVDGGATTHVFFAPLALTKDKNKIRKNSRGRTTLYVIRNVKVVPEWEAVKPSAVAIASRSLSTMMKNQANGDLFRMYYQTQELGMGYRLASVPPNFNMKSKEPFDPEYMSALFNMGEKMARDGYPWEMKPPGL